MPSVDQLPAPIICLMGPTASGKSQLALQLAEHLPLQIISVDSAMVYRGMDIGTAKPTPAELAAVPHYLIDICDPSEAYSAGRFRHDALQAIQLIQQQGAIPLLVGGTMLYFRVLQRGIAELPQADLVLRERLNDEGERLGWPFLHQRLQAIDPLAAERINPHDKQRIQRALEVYELTGQNISSLQQGNHHLPYQIINIALAPTERIILHQRIEARLHTMFAQGFVDEVRQLYQRADIHADLPAIRTVGYRQVWQYLAGDYDYAEAQQRAIFATRQLAKRQLTWLRSWPNVTWFASAGDEVLTSVLAYLQHRLKI